MRDSEETSVLYDQINPSADRIEATAKSRCVLKEKPRNLCEKCQSGHVMSRAYRNELTVFCRRIDQFVPIDVGQCNSYVPLGHVDLWELAKMAKLIEKPANEGGHYL